MLNFAATSHQPLIKSNSNFEGLLNLHLTFNKGTFYITLPPTPRCEIPVNIFRKLCFEWWGKREARWGVEGEGSESFFSESFPSQIGTWAFLRRWWGEDQEEGEEEMRKARSVCGKIWGLKGGMWTSHCENVRRKCPFCRFPGNPRHWSSRGLDMSVSLCISHIYHQPSVAAMNRSCNNLGKTEKSIHSSQSRVAIRGKLFSQAPGWGGGLPQAMAPGKRDALDFTVRAALSLIIITTSYAVAESKYSSPLSWKSMQT